MKKLFTLFALALCLTNLKAQFVTIPDANFVTWLQANVPSAMNGNQMDTTNLAVTTRTNVNVRLQYISNLTGIKFFKSLKKLNCSFNTLSNLPTLPNTLTFLDCSQNGFATPPLTPNSVDSLIIFGCTSLSNLNNLQNSLKYLDCSYCTSITNLGTLPSSIEYLDCSNNSINTVSTLPSNLKHLRINNNNNIINPNIVSSFTLPSALQTFACYENYSTTLPVLPASLRSFYCGGNYLTSLPTLPPLLTEFGCDQNQLTSLPQLPDSLRWFFCNDNQLTSLPNLPRKISIMYCGYNQLTSIPTLPDSLKDFRCELNSISCFPTFPNNIYDVLSIDGNPFVCLPNYVQSMDINTLNYPLCISGYTANNCQSSQGIVGSVFSDSNLDCSKNISENDLINFPIKLYDNNGILQQQTSTLSNGLFSFNPPNGIYNVIIDTLNYPYTSICNDPGIDTLVNISLSQPIADSINFALTCKSGFDVGVQSIHTTGFVFPGQFHILNIYAGDISHWYNLNCSSGVSGILSFSVIGPVTFVGPASGALTPIVAGNIYTYNITDFGAINNATDFRLEFQTNTTAQAGDVICVSATVTPTSGDNNPVNNNYNYCYNVVNSHDPNIKETYPENVQPGFNDWLTYTIHFQNTGNAPAFNIRLADTLDTMLDLETFQVINYSHQNIIDLTGNVLNVRFPNIQLPDSTSNSAGSIGFIQYRIKPKNTWTVPYQIKNTAYIYFDYNAPIVSSTTLNTILIPTGLHNQTETIMNLFPNPTNGSFTIELNTKEKQLVKVFDITGNLVISQTIENGKANIDANYLLAGIYNISIKGNNSVANKKLVIVK